MDMLHRLLRAALVAGTLALCFATQVDTVAKEAPDVSRRILAGLKDKERTGLSEAIADAPKAHNGTEEPAGRKKIQAALGKVLTAKKGGLSRTQAAIALGQLNDSEGAWKQLAKSLPSAKETSASNMHTEVLKAVGNLKPEKAVAPLLKLLGKLKSSTLLAVTATTLGAYGESKQRGKILSGLLDVTQRRWEEAQAAARNPKGGSAGATWGIVGEPLVAALNSLTGQSFKDAPAWLAARKKHKKKLDALFVGSND